MAFYASFQGRVHLGDRDANGNPVNVYFLGNVPNFSISLQTDVIEHFDSTSGQRAIDLRLIKQKSATISLTLEEFKKENLALAFYGNHVTNAGGSVTGEIVGGDSPITDERYFLKHQNVSNLTIVDSAATPATLAEGPNYTVDRAFGVVWFWDIAGFTPPFKASYIYGSYDEINIFTQPISERYLRFEGVNIANNNTKVLIELYRVVFDPLKRFDIITDDLARLELEGSLLADPTKPLGGALGQFGRIVQIS